EEGLLAPYDSPSAKDVPEQFKDPQHRWASNGLRARVIAEWVGATAANFVPPKPVNGLEGFAQPGLKGMTAMARPTAGTTGGHVAALYVLWGDDKARRFFHSLHDNQIKLLGGNSVVAESVIKGTIRWGLTDNDDVTSARQELRGGNNDIGAILPDE